MTAVRDSASIGVVSALEYSPQRRGNTSGDERRRLSTRCGFSLQTFPINLVSSMVVDSGSMLSPCVTSSWMVGRSAEQRCESAMSLLMAARSLLCREWELRVLSRKLNARR
jgi:hypothetical protein